MEGLSGFGSLEQARHAEYPHGHRPHGFQAQWRMGASELGFRLNFILKFSGGEKVCQIFQNVLFSVGKCIFFSGKLKKK